MTSPISIGQASLSSRPHALYRFYDRSDVLLYVGITVDPGARFKKHGGDKSWWGQVDRIGIEHFATRKEALEAERKAIKEEQPLHNVVHNEFVSSSKEDGRNQFALQILHTVLDAPPGSLRYDVTLREIQEEAEEESRERVVDHATVCDYLLNDMLARLTSLSRGHQWIVNALPSETVGRYQQREIDEWERQGLTDIASVPLESLDEAVLTGLAADLAWQYLSKAAPDDRERFLALARKRTRGKPDCARIQVEAAAYYRAYEDDNLEEVIAAEDEARRQEDEAPF